ncbi:uncharacterized protein METZ01_LOCUS456620, partial [marine metagenome]
MFLQEVEDGGCGLVELGEIEPFVRRVGLGDASRAEHDGGGAT